MGIHIICPPGRYGGVITGRLDPPIDPATQAIAIYQLTSAGWKPRRLNIPAARLWSCDLGHSFSERVMRWMAVLTPKGFVPSRTPWSAGGAFETDVTEPSPLTAMEVIGHEGRLLRGIAAPSNPPQRDALYLYGWWVRVPLASRPVGGWGGRQPEEIMRSSDSWVIGGVLSDIQYAVVQVDSRLHRLFDPADTSDNHTLASRDDVRAIVFTSPIDVRVLTPPAKGLAGCVTGLGCAYDHVRPLRPEDRLRAHERLYAVAWAFDSSGTLTIADPEECDPGGYWWFTTFPLAARNSVWFTVAITMHGYTPSGTPPTHVGGDIIAVTSFHRDVGVPSMGAQAFTGL